MDAYGIFDGGGVKGAALAGCLKGAQEAGVNFVGYGGTSAGSIVALLASVGYSANELEDIMCRQINFVDFLDDGGVALDHWKAVIDRIVGAGFGASGALRLWWRKKELKNLLGTQGLYDGRMLEHKLRTLVEAKLPNLRNRPVITFSDLRDEGALPLKVVASNLRTRRCTVLSADRGSEITDVLTAVRSSTSYPLLFKPVMVHKSALVDGGLASNLPAWLFNEERDHDNRPIVAFDLTTQTGTNPDVDYSPREFFSAMVDTALESGDELLRRSSGRVMHIEVPIDASIRTLDFGLSEAARRGLFNDGRLAALSYFNRTFGSHKVLRDPVGQLAAVYGDPSVFRAALGGLLAEARAAFPESGGLRTGITLPTGPGDQSVVVYSQGMDDDADVDLLLDRFAGPSGQAVLVKGPLVADWAKIRSNPDGFGMTKPQVVKVPANRRAVASVPIFDLRRRVELEQGIMKELRIVGALSLDSDQPAEHAGWTDQTGRPDGGFIDLLRRWSDVMGRILN
ncbi:MAG: hypothetical protein QOH86_2173 [Sphingomonadales bacterium]|nr:hypothetical protein [Sphingomonadales bacterium]